MIDEPGAIPMFVDRNRVFINQNDHTWLVIHKTASGGTAQDIASFFARDPAMASTHYAVGQDGTIVQCVSEVDGAGGNCCLENGYAAFLPSGINLNVKTISIEHVDPKPDNSTPLTDVQKAASFRLIRDICQRHNIPMRRGDVHGGIIGHCDIAPLSRARCPGNYPWEELFTFLAGGTQPLLQLNSPMGQHFSSKDATIWHCNQTNVDLAYAHLDFFRQHDGIFGLPLTNEIYLAQLPHTAIVVYERAIPIYDPNKSVDNPPGSGSVYLMHIDSGIAQQIIAKPLLAALQAQIGDLQGQVSKLQAEATNTPAAEIDALNNRISAYEAAFNQVEAIVSQTKGKSV